MFSMQLIVKPTITLEQVIRSNSSTIFYSSRNAWWTHDPDDLCHILPTIPKNLPPAELVRMQKYLEDYEKQDISHKLPTDPTGAPLFQTNDLKDWINRAISKKQNHGEYGLHAFMASHHKNSFAFFDGKEVHACYNKWDAYNEAINNYIKKNGPLDLVGDIKNFRRWKQ